jgi:hypothetical protein
VAADLLSRGIVDKFKSLYSESEAEQTEVNQARASQDWY